MCRSTKFIWVLVLLVVAYTSPASAQNTIVNPFTTADGLPSNQILAVAQDSDGRLWVGTTRGLREFFGSGFRADGIDGAIGEDWINALLVTEEGSLWVGGDSGLHRRNPDGSWDTHLEGQAGLEVDAIRTLHAAEDGAVWVGGFDGLARWYGGAWETITIDGLPPAVEALSQDASGHMWVAVLGPTGSRIEILQGHERIEVIDSDDGFPAGADLTALLRDSNGDMWAATDAGLVQFSGFSVHRIFTKKDGLVNDTVWTVIEHSEDGLWVGTAGGLNRLQDGTVTESLTSEVTRTGDSVNALAYDLEGSLWVGTSAGISRLSLGLWSTESHPLLQFTEIKGVLPGAGGTGYVVTPAGVVHRTSGGEWVLLDAGMPDQVVYTLLRDPEGTVWAGTNAGLAKVEGGRLISDTRVPTDLRAQALLVDSRGDLWVGTNEGLYRVFGGETVLFSKASGALGQNSILALWETRTGDVWVGTLNGGASRYRDGDWTIVDRGTTGYGLVDDVVVDGLEDSAANLWFATTAGVSRLQTGGDPHDPAAWRTFQIPDLAGERANALWEDNARPGNIWVGTEGGLNLISGDRSPSAFTPDDGLSHKWINALDQAPDGTLWIGTASGLTYHRDKQRPPMIELGPLLVNNEVCDAACLAEGVPYTSETATFQYTGSDLGDLANIEYLVSIRAGKVLREVQTRNRSVIQNLEPGTQYVFSVQAMDRDFNASTTAGPVELFVESPKPWDSPYFWLLGSLGFVVLSIGGYRWWLQRRFFTYSLDLEVSLTSSEEDPELQVVVEGAVRGAPRLNKILARLHIPPVLIRGFTGEPQPLKVEGSSKPDFDFIQTLETRLREQDADAPIELQTLGTRLYAVLFPDTISKKLRGLDLGRARLRLRQEAAARLKALPWELTYGGDSLGYLAVDSEVAFVRDLSDEEEERDLIVENRLRVLVALSNPTGKGLAKLTRQEDELAAIKKALEPLEKRGRVTVKVLPNARWDQFDSAVRSEEGYDLIHFTGHGGIWEGQDLPVLYFEGEDGVPIRVPGPFLVDTFRTASGNQKHRPRLVVLNACRTAQQNLIEGTIGLAEALVQEAQLPAVIGMGYQISEDAAVSFCRAFYGTLVLHGQVDRAVTMGRRALPRSGPGQLYWAAPRLYSRARDGVIFNLVRSRSETDEPDSR